MHGKIQRSPIPLKTVKIKQKRSDNQSVISNSNRNSTRKQSVCYGCSNEDTCFEPRKRKTITVIVSKINSEKRCDLVTDVCTFLYFVLRLIVFRRCFPLTEVTSVINLSLSSWE